MTASVKAIMYMYILYLRFEDALMAIMCTGTGQW